MESKKEAYFGSLGIQGVDLLLTWCVVRDTWQMNLLTHHAPRTKFVNPRRSERTHISKKHTGKKEERHLGDTLSLYLGVGLASLI